MTQYSSESLFKAVDTAGNGFIDKAALTALMEENNIRLSSEQMQQLMAFADVDDDGMISLAEFRLMMKAAARQA
ncbi:MAG: EF-hand domain-containing protein [Cyanobacteria bacterium J06628_6]